MHREVKGQVNNNIASLHTLLLVQKVTSNGSLNIHIFHTRRRLNLQCGNRINAFNNSTNSTKWSFFIWIDRTAWEKKEAVIELNALSFIYACKALFSLIHLQNQTTYKWLWVSPFLLVNLHKTAGIYRNTACIFIRKYTDSLNLTVIMMGSWCIFIEIKQALSWWCRFSNRNNLISFSPWSAKTHPTYLDKVWRAN